MRRALYASAGMAIAAAGVSALLALHHASATGVAARFVQAVCGGPQSGCDVINRSQVAIFIGIPLALWGFLYYGTFAVLALVAASPSTSDARRATDVAWLRALALTGVGVDVGLLAWSVFGLGALCSLCAATYALGLGLAAATIVAARREPLPRERERERFRPTLAHVFGLFAVLSTGALLGGGARTSALVLPADATPEDALTVAWNTFNRIYLATPEQKIETDGSPRRGSTKPVLTMTLFADFQCQHCQRVSERLVRFTDAHREAVQLVFKHYPLDKSCNPLADTRHAGSCLLARAAEAAARQNRFWHFHDALFASREAWASGVAPERLVSFAEKAGLDAERFARDFEAPEVAARVARDVAEANGALDVTATPMLFVNGRKMKSIPIDEFLEELLLAEATRLRPIGLESNREARVRAGH